MCRRPTSKKPGRPLPVITPTSPLSTIASATFSRRSAKPAWRRTRSSSSPRITATCSSPTAAGTSSSPGTNRSGCRFCCVIPPCSAQRAEPSTYPSTRRTSCRPCSASAASRSHQPSKATDFSGVLKGESPAPDYAALIECPSPFGQWDRSSGGREYRGVRTRRYTYVRDLKGPWLLYDNETGPVPVGQPMQQA